MSETTSPYWIYAGVLVFLLLILIGGMVSKHAARSTQARAELNEQMLHYLKQDSEHTIALAKALPKQKTRHEEVIDTLDWMLQNAIIDTKQYNELMVKSLPYYN